MLVQFIVKNVLSFKEKTVLDMTSINAYKEHQSNLIKTKNKNLIRVAAIYGANASGKSNLCLAMKLFQNIIRESMNNVDYNEKSTLEKYYQPFSFEKNTENSEFQIIEIYDHYEYNYGFEYNSKHIVAEWLYIKDLNTNRTKTIVERSNDEIVFGPSVRKECDIYKDQIPEKGLVISFFNRLKLKNNSFSNTYLLIMYTLVASSDFGNDKELLIELLPDIIDNNKEKLIQFLACIDTGIKDIDYEEMNNWIRFSTYHVGKDGNRYALNLLNESEGTLKSIYLFIIAQTAIMSNKSIFIDELNVKLHPLLLKYFIDLFYDEGTQAQLIYTTHDTTLMDKKFFRRDQIYFVQKDEYGYSELSSLSDFKVRSDASFEKDYLAGVYGGIPTFNDFEMKDGE